MIELITDRTQTHVNRLKQLQAKGWDNLSASERTEWYGVAAKGAYNYTDLNRVETAVAMLAESLALELITKTNWTVWDVPTQSDMLRYLGNIRAVRDAVPGNGNMPDVPIKMNGLTFEAANRIEEILLASWQNASTLPRCGELFCGEV